MTFEIALVLGVVTFIIVSLFKEWLRPGVTFIIGIVILLIFNIITPQQALNGFANEQLAIIVFLLILSNILRKSRSIESIFRSFFKKTDSPKLFLTKMTAGVGFFSAFLNNTPLVAMLMPYVYAWSKDNNHSPSKFLIPLSYASILGGCLTLYGTSTILIANAVATRLGAPSLTMFDPSVIGGAMFLLGGLYLILFSNKLLPDNQHKSDSSDASERQYFMETLIEKDSPIIGKTIEDAGLRNLEGLFLIEIIRANAAIRPVSPNEILQEGDLLFFAGDVKTISNLNAETLGISLPKASDFLEKNDRDIAEVVVSHNSVLHGRTIKEVNFRSKYNGAVVAIHRNGERVWGQLGNIQLRSGDVLLVLVGDDFRTRIENSQDFYRIANITKEKQIPDNRILLLFGGMLAAITLSALNLFPLFNSLLLLIIVSILTKLAKARDVRNSIDFNLILIIGLGIALGSAMESSGTTAFIAQNVVKLGMQHGVLVLLTLLFVVSNILSSVITSAASVAVIIPISLQLASSLGAPAKPFILIVALAAAANFATPIGYQTNIMVYGPGGYKFKDFFRIGFPLTILYGIICVTLLYIIYI